ncbi:MAG: response regulator [Clostridiales bacterium]|jgi:two-component system response regulator Irr|nr:response regulator [Clostridiales bacterium]
MAEKILVAEDDPTINEVVCEYLKDAGFEAISAPDGKAAAERVSEAYEISLFILDIMLPSLSGMDLLRMIRAARPTITSQNHFRPRCW